MTCPDCGRSIATGPLCQSCTNARRWESMSKSERRRQRARLRRVGIVANPKRDPERERRLWKERWGLP